MTYQYSNLSKSKSILLSLEMKKTGAKEGFWAERMSLVWPH